jgi:hypothetical protein
MAEFVKSEQPTLDQKHTNGNIRHMATHHRKSASTNQGNGKRPPYQITHHARDKWRKLSDLLDLDASMKSLTSTLQRAVPEQITSRRVRFCMLKRTILRGRSRTLTMDGWRFVIANGVCMTIERIIPHENFLPQREEKGKRSCQK